MGWATSLRPQSTSLSGLRASITALPLVAQHMPRSARTSASLPNQSATSPPTRRRVASARSGLRAHCHRSGSKEGAAVRFPFHLLAPPPQCSSLASLPSDLAFGANTMKERSGGPRFSKLTRPVPFSNAQALPRRQREERDCQQHSLPGVTRPRGAAYTQSARRGTGLRVYAAALRSG